MIPYVAPRTLDPQTLCWVARQLVADYDAAGPNPAVEAERLVEHWGLCAECDALVTLSQNEKHSDAPLSTPSAPHVTDGEAGQ